MQKLHPVLRRRQEAGMAMLLVIAMAAALAWILYMEMPRLAFENQREKEERLVERGNQFVRAVQVYARDQKRYPQTIEQLENTNGRRYLRRRYVDPFTGKDEWRFIHANAAGQVTDSLVKKTTNPNDPNSPAPQQASGFGSNQIVADPNAPKPEAVRRRDSEQLGAPGLRPLPGQQVTDGATNPDGTPMTPEQLANSGQPNPNNPQNPNGQQVSGPALPPGIFPPGLFPPGVVPNQPNPGGTPQTARPNMPGYPTSASNSQTGGSTSGFGSGGGAAFGSSGSANSAIPPNPNNVPGVAQGGFGQGSFGQGGFGGTPRPGAPQANPAGFNNNNATSLIQNLLTRPNPNGLANAMNNNTGGFGEGIVGIASKVDREGIKIFNERTNIKEWEFVYDPTKENGGNGTTAAPGQMPGTPGTVGPGLNSGQNGFGGPGSFGNPSSVGSPSGFGNNSGFGRRP